MVPRGRSMGSLARAMAAAASMPPCEHWVGRRAGKHFDAAASAVFAYLAGSPEIREWLFQSVKSAGLIVFDPATGRWQGRDFFSPDTPVNPTNQVIK